MSLEIGISGTQSYGGEEPIHSTSLSHINLGAKKHDGTALYVYDAVGRLYELPRAEDGTFLIDIDSSTYDPRRAQAIAAWEIAHATLLEASKDDPDIELRDGRWSERRIQDIS